MLVLKNIDRRLPTGTQFSSFAIPEQAGRQTSLSPNGRLLAIPVSGGLRVLEVATGDLVCPTSGVTEAVNGGPRTGSGR